MSVPNIGSVMTKDPVTVPASAPIKEAKMLMFRQKIRHLPVLDQGKVVGLISDRDIKLAQAVANHPNFDEERLVREVCVYNPYSVHPASRLDEVLEQMLKLRIGSALVIAGERLVGIFTKSDACKTLLRVMRPKSRSSKDQLHSELE